MNWTPVIVALVPSVAALITAVATFIKSKGTADTLQSHLDSEHNNTNPPTTAGL